MILRVTKRVGWALAIAGVLGLAVFLTGNYEVADRLGELFVALQPWLPPMLSVEQFLSVVTVGSLLTTILVVAGGAVLLTRLSLHHTRRLGATAAAALEVAHIKAEHWRQHRELLSLGQTLTKRLDKRVLAQAIVGAANRVTSRPQATSIVSLWLLNFETDTIRFERGLHCDAAMFTKTEFQPTEPPFAHVIATQEPWVPPVSDDALALIKRDAVPQLGQATGVMVIPLVIENSVLGILVMCCHQDVLKSYEEQKPFYDTFWAELALALAIAIQGEVALLDRLTGVYNREYFMKRLSEELERANRFRLPLSLLMVDIDNFKLVNDTLGHQQGDAVLKIIAKLIRKEVRATDLVARYGGEEFVALLPETGYGADASGAASASVVAERIRKAVDDEFRGMQPPLNLTVSVGVAVRRFPEDRRADARELIRQADEQLYRAKTSGKNTVCMMADQKPQGVA